MLFEYYGPLLGHNLTHIRHLAAQCFVVVIRKLKPIAFQSHAKRLFKAIRMNYSSSSITHDDDAESALLSQLPCELEGKTYYNTSSTKDTRVDDEDGATSSVASHLIVGQWSPPKRIRDVLDGAALLLSQSCQGVKGCLHSKGGSKLSDLLSSLQPLSGEMMDTLDAWILAQSQKSTIPSDPTMKTGKKSKRGVELKVSSTETTGAFLGNQELSVSALAFINGTLLSTKHSDLVLTVVTGWLVNDSIRRLFRHIHPSQGQELWVRIMACTQNVLRSWATCQQLAAFSDEPDAREKRGITKKLLQQASFQLQCN